MILLKPSVETVLQIIAPNKRLFPVDLHLNILGLNKSLNKIKHRRHALVLWFNVYKKHQYNSNDFAVIERFVFSIYMHEYH